MAEMKRPSEEQSQHKSTARRKPGSAQKPGKATPLTVKQQTPLHRRGSGSFYIVGIGASAGGLEAFEKFFRNMPADSGIAFVLIPHLDPTHKSILADLLQRYTKMTIVQAQDGMKVQPNVVHIIPPNKDMSILHGTLQLFEPVKSQGIRHPIDFFFRSLAEDQREKAVAVILSGTGTEGVLGLKAIKGEGGLVLVQDVMTAKYDGMPGSAIATGLADHVLPPDRMPEQLLRYIRRPYSKPVPLGEQPARTSQNLLQKIFVLIRAQTDHDFSLYKQMTILRRIEKRMAMHQIGRLADYVTYLRDTPPEVEALFKELLIRVTNFFRDPEAFEVLKSKVLPHVLKSRPADAPLRIWVPGCSTGEEAYSLAIIVRECAQMLKAKFKVQIFATDIDGAAIETARAGLYAESISVDVSPERLTGFFVRKGAKYKIKEDIRGMVVFAVQDVVKDPPFSRLDMISCRNLLIYMSADLQKKLLPLFSYSLKPGGILFLGSSENIGDRADMFSVLDKKWRIYAVKRSAVVPLPADLHHGRLPDAVAKPEQSVEFKTPGDDSIGVLTEQLLLESYVPACVIADEKGDILYFHGRTGAYLEPASGKARLNVVDMAREGLRRELRTGLGKAMTQGEDILLKGLRVKMNGGFKTVDLEVKYIKKPERLRGLVMVVFHETAQIRGEKTARPKLPPEGKPHRRTAELEWELKSAKEHLQSTIEELETSNEELQSLNEELQSANEELQSTNEEIETSQEELQSVNEELITVNAELQKKIDELVELNDDMSNMLAGTQIATIFLSNDLLIKRFTPATTDIIHLIQADLGRPISDIAAKLDYDVVKDAEEVLRTLASKEREVPSRNGRWYVVRIMPYRTVANVIDGVVVTFADVTAQKRAQEDLREALDFTEAIVETVREPLVILNGNLQVIRANNAFYKTFDVSPGMTEKRLIYELGNRQWDIPALRELLESILPENSQVLDFVVDHEFPGIGRKKMLLNARRMARQEARTQTILLAIEDITDRKDRHEQ